MGMLPKSLGARLRAAVGTPSFHLLCVAGLLYWLSPPATSILLLVVGIGGIALALDRLCLERGKDWGWGGLLRGQGPSADVWFGIVSHLPFAILGGLLCL